VTAGVVSYMLLCWGVVFAGLVILTSSPYSSELLVPGEGLVCLQGFDPSFSHIFIVVFLIEFTSPYSLNTQQGWHTSKNVL